MPIFRGTGGSGNASTDAYASEISTHAQTATTKANEASTSATAAATSATASASSATASASSATAAASSATAAAATKNSIDEFYLGAQSSNPTVDNNGDSVTAGDWYFNTGSNTTRIYDGSAWQTINPDLVGDTSPQLGGNLDLNSKDITGTGNVSITGNVVLSGTVDGRDVAADGTKLDGIESSATADQTNSEIRALVESASDSNVFTDADHTKLNGIEASADVTDATNVASAGAVMDGDFSSNGFMKRTGAGAYTVDTNTYITGNQTITLSGAVTGSGTTSITTTLSTIDGGTY